MNVKDSLLGKTTIYKDKYDKSLLFKIPRTIKRKELGIDSNYIPFYGVDIWNAYELSWLNNKGKPCVAIARLYIPASSEFLVESKSLKLYFNSFNNNNFASIGEVSKIIEQDLSSLLGTKIKVELFDLLDTQEKIGIMPGENIDSIDVECLEYDTANPALLKFKDSIVNEEINSNFLKSNCLITNQPDWGSITIKYSGKKLDRSSVLQYIVSLRNHNEFHEQCVERIFCDIKKAINPSFLSVYARYTRRGGIDICPYRTTNISFKIPDNIRLIRQ